MKIHRLHAKKIYGHLNVDVQFNDDLTILTGMNGSGKTTAIRLIRALLGLSSRDLAALDFDHASLTVLPDRKSSEAEISARPTPDSFEISVTGVAGSLKLPRVEPDDAAIGKQAIASRAASFEARVIREVGSHPVVQFIMGLAPTVVLGIERSAQQPSLTEPDDTTPPFIGTARDTPRRRREIGGLHAVGLLQALYLVHEAYRVVVEKQKTRLGSLRQGILLSAFRYRKMGDATPIWPPSPEKIEEAIKRRNEIEKELAGLGEMDENLSKAFTEFFENLGDLGSRLASNADMTSITVEWLVNLAQVERISDVVRLIDNNRAQMRQAQRPIDTFIDIVNGFYVSGGKALEVDAVGWLSVVGRDGMHRTVEALSSGERQLLTIFANLVFQRHGSDGAFIIDEPELSLHLEWQEALLDAMAKASPKTQLIVATHSPEIVGDRSHKCVDMTA